MGYYTGKYDFQDYLEMNGFLDNDENFNKFKEKSKVYIGDERLVFETKEDLIPYYTHVISMSYTSEGLGGIHLTSKSWLELEDEKYYPNRYRFMRMKDFDKFVKDNGKIPIWSIPLEERAKWVPCPLGEPYFCEPKLNNGNGSKGDTVFCPYMYANRRQPCKMKKYLDKYNSREDT